MEDSAGVNEHLIRCSYCGRKLIVSDLVNDGKAFLSHLKNDHDIFYVFERMTSTRTAKPSSVQTVLKQPE